VKAFNRHSVGFPLAAAAACWLAACGGEPTERDIAESVSGAQVPASAGAKIEFPVSVSLALKNQPQPGGVAEVELSVMSEFPEACTGEVELVLPERVRMERGRAAFERQLPARARVAVPWQLRIPDEGRYVIEARVTVPNPEGLPATTGSSLVIDLGGAEKIGKEPAVVRTSDGRELSITVTE